MTLPLTRSRKRLTPAEILPLDEYAEIRTEARRRINELKRRRRVEVGPFATFYFENFDTMWLQVQEMLHIEKGGETQLKDELEAYNPLIPQGSELIATVMFEIEDAARRGRLLAALGGIEDNTFIEVPMAQGSARLRGEPDPTRENTNSEGKASSVQFIRFPFTGEQMAAFRRPDAKILIGFDHANYGHQATLPEPVRAALAEDFD